MNKLKQLSVGQQLLFTFGALCAVLVTIGGLLFFGLRSIERSNQLQQSRALNKLALIDDSAQDVGEMQAQVLREVIAVDPAQIKNLDQTVRDTEKINAKELADYQKFMDTEEEKQLYDKVMQARKTYWEQTQPVLALGIVNRDAEATEIINSTQGRAYDDLLKTIDDLIDDVEGEAKKTAAATTHFISKIRIIGDALVGVAIFIAVGTGFSVAGVARRLKQDNIVLQTEVAERKRAEETLHESEERFRQMAENITDVFWMTSPDLQKTLYVSPAYELVWGRSAESLYAHPQEWAEAILPEERERVFALFSRLGEEPSASIEFQIMRPDGEMRWIHSRGFPVRDPSGNVIRLTGIATDITERKRAAEELRESERRFTDMMRNLELISLMLDRDARITYCNEYFLRLTGWRHEEVIGGDWFELFVPPGLVAELRDFHSTLLVNQPDTWHHENEIVTRFGTRRLILWNNSVLRSASGEVIGTASIGEDVTDRKRLEARLMQSQKMETVGKLAGGVAHEFNSILTAIIGQSELLLSDLPPEDPLVKNAREIRQAADRAATLTRQLLAYGRKQILQPEILDLNLVLSDMASTLQHLMGREVDVRIVPAVGLKTIKIDPGQMEQVIVNIAMNAADAMPNGGKLTLETANVALDEEYVRSIPGLKAGGYVMLAITDTGIGMSEEVKARAFEPFFSTKGVGQGTGLGLATCYGILKQSNGHINVYSEVARGATFKIYLPQVEERATIPLPRANPSDLPRGTETILLAEDDPSLREMSATLLKRLGYTVLTAANGVEALGLKQQRDIGHIDLLFTDVVMPHMSGKELSDRIRTIYPRTKILFTSAYTESAIVHQGILNEGVALLQKPFTPSALAHKIREILDQ